MPWSLDVHPVQLEIWLRQEPWERLDLAMQLSRQLVEGNFAYLKSLHPDWSERQLRHRWAELNYGRELADAAYADP